MILGGSAMGIVAPAIPSFLKAAASAQQVLKVLGKVEKQVTPTDASLTLESDKVIGHLSLRGVTFCYPERPSTKVLDHLDLDIPAGKTTAIVGHSGCGKSTIIGLVEQWYSPSEGLVVLDGIDIEHLNVFTLRDQIGLVQQV
jgi:ATP-binding cassette subfamily B (MDR/TAP) protein 1